MHGMGAGIHVELEVMDHALGVLTDHHSSVIQHDMRLSIHLFSMISRGALYECR